MALAPYRGLLGKDNPISQFIDPRRNALMGFSAGMLSGNPGMAMTGAMQGAGQDQQYAQFMADQAAQEQETNATRAWLEQSYPEYAMLPPGEGFKLAMAAEQAKRSGGGASSMPANVQEWEYFSQLSPEDQSRYLNMKRSNSPLNIGTGFVTQDPANPGAILGGPIAIDNLTPARDSAVGAGLGEQQLSTLEAGRNAERNNATLGVLETLLESAPQGGQGRMVQIAGGFGIDLGGLSEVQAADALISQLVPLQRAPGSGTMSDADLDLYKRSLPSILNQPGANQLVIETQRALNDYTIAHARIEQQVLEGRITEAQAAAQKQDIPNPLENFKRFVSGQSGTGNSATPAPAVAPAGNVIDWTGL